MGSNLQYLVQQYHDANEQYSLNNPPSLEVPSFIIEQKFLRHQKVGSIPNLDKYLEKLNSDSWTGLLAWNPREEFIKYLKDDMVAELNWKFILNCILGQTICKF